MAKKTKSKLQEIDFSSFNLRDAYITSYPEYAAALRDEALFSNYSIKAIIKIPKIENNVDEYSNFVDDDFEITTESVIPLFNQYRQNVSIEGMAADGTQGLYPLEVIIPTKLHLPKNSRIVLTEFNSKEQIIAREWTVLSTEMKQLSGSKTYTRIANCVPSRKIIHHTAEFDEIYGKLYFQINSLTDKYKTGDFRCNLDFYFCISQVKFKKTLSVDVVEGLSDQEVYQEIPVVTESENPQIEESYVSDTDPAYRNIKTLHTTKDPIASFVIKSTAISVLY